MGKDPKERNIINHKSGRSIFSEVVAFCVKRKQVPVVIHVFPVSGDPIILWMTFHSEVHALCLSEIRKVSSHFVVGYVFKQRLLHSISSKLLME